VRRTFCFLGASVLEYYSLIFFDRKIEYTKGLNPHAASNSSDMEE